MHGYIENRMHLASRKKSTTITCNLWKDYLEGDDEKQLVFEINSQKNRTDKNKSRYTKQRNYFVSLLRKAKMQYYSNLDEKHATDNKEFWKSVKPFLWDTETFLL